MKLYRDIIKLIREHYENHQEDFFEYDFHYYVISFENKKIYINEINEILNYNDDVDLKQMKWQLKEIECTENEYIEFLKIFIYKKTDYMRYKYPEHNYILNKIEIW